MQRLIRYAALVTTLLAALGGGAAQGQALSPYVMQKISQPGSAINYAQGINNSGVAVGAADPGGSFSTIFFRAAVFSPAAPVSGPGELVGFLASYDYAINDAGQSVGWALKLLGVYPGPTLTHAALFVHGTGQDLGALIRGGNSTAYAINALGIAVGSADSAAPNNPTHATLFTFANHTVTDLGLPPGDQTSVAYGINGYGQVVGSSIGTDGIERAVQFLPGPPHRLGALPGDSYSQARGINDQGQAAGYSGSLTGQTHAVVFAAGQVIDLGVYPGGTYSVALAINNFGQVVGAGDIGDGSFSHALLFQNGQVIDLGKLPGGDGSQATAINDHGDMVGTADDGGGTLWAVKWTLAHHFVGPVRALAAE